MIIKFLWSSKSIGINSTLFLIGTDGNIFFFSRKMRIFFLLNDTSNWAKYSLLINSSSLIENESIIPLISFKDMSLIFSLSPEVVIIEIKFTNATLNPLSITLFLLKLSSNGEEIFILDTLKVFAYKKVVEKNIINRT